MGVCYIVGAAPTCTPFSPKEGDLVIAADGGRAALALMGIRPDLVVGDFDSSIAPDDLPIVRHPVQKDDTDTALAIEEGRARGYTTFVLHGCTGGRADHSFGVVQTLLSVAKRGERAYLVGDGMVGTVVVNGSFPIRAEGKVSVFSLSERSEGVNILGLVYPLVNGVLTNDHPLGVSNEGSGSDATVSVEKGALYILWEAEHAPV
ncbi:MAG: thiamine diphosphokinase [Clostridia bacterium]|nr:thiamine diphosphokinase [Clostridia bacterium]